MIYIFVVAGILLFGMLGIKMLEIKYGRRTILSRLISGQDHHVVKLQVAVKQAHLSGVEDAKLIWKHVIWGGLIRLSHKTLELLHKGIGKLAIVVKRKVPRDSNKGSVSLYLSSIKEYKDQLDRLK